jgi:hypothetical protein
MAILSVSFPNLKVISVIKDFSLALTITVSIAFNIKLDVSYKKYETNIKEMIIQNQNNYYGDEQNARSMFLLDNDNSIIKKLIDSYKHIELYFKQYDFSTPHPGNLFDNIMNMCNHEFKDSTFRFSDNELDTLLRKIITSTEEFVHYMVANVFPLNDRLFVTKYWDKRKEGFTDNELKEFKDIDDKMYDLLTECVKDYRLILQKVYPPSIRVTF